MKTIEPTDISRGRLQFNQYFIISLLHRIHSRPAANHLCVLLHLINPELLHLGKGISSFYIVLWSLKYQGYFLLDTFRIMHPALVSSLFVLDQLIHSSNNFL